MTTPAPRAAPATERLIHLDAMRAVSMLYIIGYWHLFNYTNAFPGYYNAVTARLTVSVLGLFVLLSGYLAGTQSGHQTRHAVANFYRKRLAKIIPPYLIALVVFGVFGIADWLTIAKGAALISMFYEPAPPTLWFITMIIFFYLITPVFLSARTNGWKYLALGLLFFLTLALYEVKTGLLDPRIAMYMPCYLLGLYLAQHEIKPATASLVGLVLFAAAALFISLKVSGNIEQDFLSTPLALAGALVLFLLAKGVRYTRATAAIQMISSASYFMYLAHRPIFTALKKIYFPDSGSGQVIYLLLFCLPVVIFVSYHVQYFYTQLTRRKTRNQLAGAGQDQ